MNAFVTFRLVTVLAYSELKVVSFIHSFIFRSRELNHWDPMLLSGQDLRIKPRRFESRSPIEKTPKRILWEAPRQTRCRISLLPLSKFELSILEKQFWNLLPANISYKKAKVIRTLNYLSPS